jgi:hypothetical protein
MRRPFTIKAVPAGSGRGTDFGAFMRKYTDEIEQDALDLLGRFGHAAVYVARELAETAEEHRGQSAQAWHNIADAIDRLSMECRSGKPWKP